MAAIVVQRQERNGNDRREKRIARAIYFQEIYIFYRFVVIFSSDAKSGEGRGQEFSVGTTLRKEKIDMSLTPKL